MSGGTPDISIRRTRRQNSSGNNQPSLFDDDQGPETLLSRSDDTEIETLLRNAGFLYGFKVNGKDGPRRSTQPVAKLQDNARLSSLIQEYNNMITEIVPTKTDRNANYAHQGWSTSSISTTTPWIASRIATRNESPGENLWMTKRTVIQRLAINVALQDLVPASEFEEDVLAALGKPSNPEKFQALDQVFQLWGDVIPLEFDLGSSLSITDLQKNFDQASDSNDTNELQSPTAFKTRRINTQGGEANTLNRDTKSWITTAVPPNLWSQVRVLHVVPITRLLKSETNEKLVELYSMLLSYHPPALRDITGDSKVVDGSSHALKTISSLIIHSNNNYVIGIIVVYMDGTISGELGDCGAKVVQVFMLNNGEYITEIMVWADAEWVYGFQFITSDGRASPHYGGKSGKPSIVSSKDGVLVGFSGNMKTNFFQTIWRHDVMETRPIQRGNYFEYIGGSGGIPFNDWPCLWSSTSAYISSVSIKSTNRIVSIQVTYTDNRTGEVVFTEGPIHGGPEGTESLFKLEPGEHIVGVQGRKDGGITQLLFTTNLGRVSDVYGSNVGNPFKCQPPRKQNSAAMRLSYIAGKCGSLLDGVLFVWAPM